MVRARMQVPVLVVLAAFAVVAGPVSAQKVTLRWKYQPGSEMVYRVNNRQNMDMGVMGAMTSDQIQTLRWRVTEVAPNGDATVTVTTERIQLDMQGMAGPIKYDSETDSLPADPQAKVLASLAGLSYTMVIGTDGKVKAVQGLDELRQTVLGGIAGEQAAMAQAMTSEMFSEESMTRMMQQSVQLFPEEPVGPSDTWSNSFSMPVPMIGSMTTNMTFTLTGVEQRDGRTVAVITNTGTIVMSNDGSSPLPMSFDISDTKLHGTIDFDVDRGITLATEMTTTMQMAVDAGGQQMAIGMNQTTSLELLEFVPGK